MKKLSCNKDKKMKSDSVSRKNKKSFRDECKRQSLVLKNDKHEKDILKFLDFASDRTGWK